MNSYGVTVTRTDGVWFAEVDGFPGDTISAAGMVTFEDLDLKVRDLVANLTGTDRESFNLAWRVVFADVDVSKLVASVRNEARRYGFDGSGPE